MTRRVVSVSPDSTLYDCAGKIAKENVNSLPVVSEEKLVGIITSGDIMRLLAKKPGADLRKIKVKEIAQRKVAVVKPSAEIYQVLEKMKLLNFRRLPVISNNRLIGMITLKDILSVEPQLYSETNHLIDEIRELERKTNEGESDWPFEGLCDNCGAFSELLKVEEQLLCPDCRDELH